MPYEFLEDVATADVALLVRGQTREHMLREAAEALLAVMVETPESIQPNEYRELAASATTIEMLLFEFLQELIYLKDTDQIFLHIRNLTIEEKTKFTLKAGGYGEHIDPNKHLLKVDVKAVTLHQFQVRKKAHDWEATIVFDI
jgi:SHS2 domain-containing protein